MDEYYIKCVDKADYEHLNATLYSLYNITSNWSVRIYLGLTLKWDYKSRTYIETTLQKLKHAAATQPHHSNHPWNLPNYGKPTHLTTAPDQYASLPVDKITHLQQSICYLLFNFQVVKSTMIPALVTLASSQSRGTQETSHVLTQLMKYAATHPDATLRFSASDMVLHIHSN